jgi:hypothetical protein
MRLSPQLRKAAGPMYKIRSRILYIGLPAPLFDLLAASRTSHIKPFYAIAG